MARSIKNNYLMLDLRGANKFYINVKARSLFIKIYDLKCIANTLVSSLYRVNIVSLQIREFTQSVI